MSRSLYRKGLFMNSIQTLMLRTLWTCLVFSLAVMFSTGCSGNAFSASKKTLDVTVTGGRFEVVIENKGSPEAAGKQIELYINEVTPDGYKQSIDFPRLGESINVHLDLFAKQDGTKFNPKNAVKDLWIGGNGYAFTRHGEKPDL